MHYDDSALDQENQAARMSFPEGEFNLCAWKVSRYTSINNVVAV